MPALELFTDGGARGNPGPAGIGAVLRHGGRVVETVAAYVGETTNNQAEYRALIAGLRKALSLGYTVVAAHLDSELLVRQLTFRYKVKAKELQPLFREARNLTQQFRKVTFTHIPREKNRAADRLVNRAIDDRRAAEGNDLRS